MPQPIRFLHAAVLPIIFSFFLVVCSTLSPVHAQDLVTLEGWLTVLWGDERGGGSTGPFFQVTGHDGTATDLVVTEPVRRRVENILALNGRYVGIQGTVDGLQGMSFNGSGGTPLIVSSITVLPTAETKDALMEPEDAPLVSGSRPWISIMCKFSDQSAEPRNLAYFQNMYAATAPGLNHYWREQSYETANIDGSTAAGWFVLPQPESYYNPTDTLGGTNRDALANDCIAAADASVDFSQFGGINMMFNTDFDNGYAWGGSRYMTLDGVFKKWSVTWEPPWGYADITVIAHEMGHGYGLPHSSGNYGETYDNEWDVMSDSWSNCTRSRDTTYGCLGQHTISYHKDMLGWIPAGQKYVTTENSAATLSLEQIALPATANYKMVKIPIPGSSTRFYTVEVRRQTGYDYKLPGQGVIIHEVDTARDRPAYVIDVDGDGDTGDDGARWEVGEAFADETNGIFVEVLSATDTGFDVRVQVGDLPGDIDLSGYVNLKDVLMALQITGGMTPTGSPVAIGADVNGDGRIGLAEAIYAMREMAGN